MTLDWTKEGANKMTEANNKKNPINTFLNFIVAHQ
jgi:hypothetical protein